MTFRFPSRARGFSSVELLLALAIGAALIGAAAIAYGSIAKSQPSVGSSVYVTINSATFNNLIGQNVSTWATATAPSYGALALAEDLRENFLEDTLKATAVYCLSRTDINTFRPTTIPYDPSVDIVLDTNQNFRQHLKNKGLITNTSFVTTSRYYDAVNTHSSVFIIGYSSALNQLTVNAIYDIDVVRPSSPATGYYAVVGRYVGTVRTQYFDIYYPSPQNPSGLKADSENFAPIWVSFERLNRKDKPETVDLDRFKAAREKPFHFIWWPDPAARNLGMQFSSNSAYAPTDPRKVYNHMAGRTSFMFTVPMFPSL